MHIEAKAAQEQEPLKATRRETSRPKRTRMTEDPDLIDYLLLLRFGPAKHPQPGQPLVNYASISRLVRKPLSTI